MTRSRISGVFCIPRTGCFQWRSTARATGSVSAIPGFRWSRKCPRRSGEPENAACFVCTSSGKLLDDFRITDVAALGGDRHQQCWRTSERPVAFRVSSNRAVRRGGTSCAPGRMVAAASLSQYRGTARRSGSVPDEAAARRIDAADGAGASLLLQSSPV